MNTSKRAETADSATRHARFAASLQSNALLTEPLSQRALKHSAKCFRGQIATTLQTSGPSSFRAFLTDTQSLFVFLCRYRPKAVGRKCGNGFRQVPRLLVEAWRVRKATRLRERAWIRALFVTLRANAAERGNNEAVLRIDSIVGAEIYARTPEFMPVVTFRQYIHPITPPTDDSASARCVLIRVILRRTPCDCHRYDAILPSAFWSLCSRCRG